MNDHKPSVFPTSFLVSDDRAGAGRSSSSAGGRAGGPKVDLRKTPLRKIPLFADISEVSLGKLEKHAVRINFAKGQHIVIRGDPSRDVFLLLSGQARVTFFSTSGKAVAFRRIAPGDMFGEFAAIDGQGRSATVEATKSASALCISVKLFWDLMENDRAFTATIMRHLVYLLRSLTSRIVEYSTLGVKNRIHCELLRMAKAALKDSGSSEISPAPTHSDLAARISTHREAVSRELSRLTKLGIIQRKGRTLILNDLDRLERMVHEASGE